jgi:hypothetical protein
MKWLAGIEPWFIEVPLLAPGGHGVVRERIACIAPHEAFALFYRGGPDTFKATCLGPDGEKGAAMYWKEAAAGSSAAAGLAPAGGGSAPISEATPAGSAASCIPLPPQGCDRNRALPTLWHADGCELYTMQSFRIFSWSVATVWGGDVHDQMHYITLLEDREWGEGKGGGHG